MISYDKLWQTMKEKGVTQYALIKNTISVPVKSHD